MFFAMKKLSQPTAISELLNGDVACETLNELKKFWSGVVNFAMKKVLELTDDSQSQRTSEQNECDFDKELAAEICSIFQTIHRLHSHCHCHLWRLWMAKR